MPPVPTDPEPSAPDLIVPMEPDPKVSSCSDPKAPEPSVPELIVPMEPDPKVPSSSDPKVPDPEPSVPDPKGPDPNGTGTPATREIPKQKVMIELCILKVWTRQGTRQKTGPSFIREV